jgi:hypothetical protein
MRNRRFTWWRYRSDVFSLRLRVLTGGLAVRRHRSGLGRHRGQAVAQSSSRTHGLATKGMRLAISIVGDVDDPARVDSLWVQRVYAAGIWMVGPPSS